MYTSTRRTLAEDNAEHRWNYTIWNCCPRCIYKNLPEQIFREVIQRFIALWFIYNCSIIVWVTKNGRKSRCYTGSCYKYITNPWLFTAIENPSLIIQTPVPITQRHFLILHPHNIVFDLFFSQQMNISIPDNFLIYNRKIFTGLFHCFNKEARLTHILMQLHPKYGIAKLSSGALVTIVTPTPNTCFSFNIFIMS